MPPASYAAVTAAVLVAGGLLACFAGYRLFRLVLGLYGFAAGAIITTTMMGDAGMWTLALAAIVGGLVGALLMLAAYFFGVGLVGAGLAVLGINVVWQFFGGEPPTAVLVIVAVIGALAALAIARFVVIFGTALAGSWTAILGGLALFGRPEPLEAASAGDVWVLFSPQQPDDWWLTAAWFGLTLAGALVQTATRRRRKRRKRKSD
jgi:hypothetical protein